MGLRRRATSTSYYEVSDSDDDFIDTTPLEDEALKGWGEARQNTMAKKSANTKEKFLAQDVQQFNDKNESPVRNADSITDKSDDVASVPATATPPKPVDDDGNNDSPERDSENAHDDDDEPIHTSPEPTPPRRSGRSKRSRFNSNKMDDDDDDDFDLADAEICVEDSDEDFENDADESDFELEPVKKKKKTPSPPQPKKKKKSGSTSTAAKSTATKSTKSKAPARSSLKPAKVGLKPGRPIVRKPLKSAAASGSGLPGLKPRGRMMVIPTGPPKRFVPLNGAPRRRSGLSRLEKVPRLHKYLKDE